MEDQSDEKICEDAKYFIESSNDIIKYCENMLCQIRPFCPIMDLLQQNNHDLLMDLYRDVVIIQKYNLDVQDTEAVIDFALSELNFRTNTKQYLSRIVSCRLIICEEMKNLIKLNKI
jgi:hypothetical protein